MRDWHEWNNFWNNLSFFIASMAHHRINGSMYGDEHSRLEAQLQRYSHALTKAVRGGFNYYFREYGNEAFKHTPRTRASLINDHIVDEANRVFADEYPEIAPFKAKGRRLFEVPDVAILHLKKLDHLKRTSNYPTLFALAFNDPEEFLPGFGPLPRLAVGYVPTKNWTGIDGIFITRPDGDSVRWFIELEDDGSNPYSLTKATPNAPIPSKRRAKPKGGLDQRKNPGQS